MKQEDIREKMKFGLIILLILTSFLPTEGSGKILWKPSTECPKHMRDPYAPGVFITVSSLAYAFNNTHVMERQLELNWYNVKPLVTDWVGLFDDDPSMNSSNVLDRAEAYDYSDGYFRTSVMLPYYEFTQNDFKKTCLNFWVGYFRNDTLVATDCLKIQPNWMWENRDSIGNFSLADIMIPGTHNSGSYQRYHRKRSENILARYKMCQDEDIWTQLVYGIRHLDLRLGFYAKLQEKYWLNHEYLRIHPFSISLERIKEFINSTNEIVILDFHRFPVGFRNLPEHHFHFISYLERELHEFMIPRSYGFKVKLNQLWGRNQRLLVMYSSEYFSTSEYLWPGLSQVWASTTEEFKLLQHIQNYVTLSKPTLWAAMAELTPTMWEVLTNPSGSLRIYADNVNRNVTKWFRDFWWERASIVATDYFHGNNIIDVTIEANKRRRWCRSLFLTKNKSEK